MENIAKYKYYIYTNFTNCKTLELELTKTQFIKANDWLLLNANKNKINYSKGCDIPNFEITTAAAAVGDTIIVLMKTKEVK